MSPSVEPFNEAKYKALIDGLEISEICMSNLERTWRIDAEFYRKENLEVDSILSAWNKTSIENSFYVSDGNHMSISESFSCEGIPYYRGQDIYHTFIETSNPIRIDIDTFNKPQMLRSHLKKGDVLMSIVGAIIGNSSLVSTDDLATCSCKLSILRSKHKEITPETLFIYIKTKYGQIQIQKFKRGAAQTGLLLEDLDQIYTPVFTAQFQVKLQNIVSQMYTYVQRSNTAYEDARLLLESVLKIGNISCCSIAEKTFEQSFKISGRLDAEYYQPKYDEYSKALRTTNSVRSLCTLYDKNFIPDEKMEYKYIELANVGAMGEISGVVTICGRELPSRARRRVRRGQIIVASVEGSSQSCALITDEFDGALCSTGFYVLDSDSMNSETLLVLFKSEPIQALLKQRCSGTILTAISKDELLGMPLPQIDEETQKEIARKVQESFALRHKSEQLLEYAKQAVEMSIEQGEVTAMEWLESKVSE